MKNRTKNGYDEDIERHKRFPWRSSMRRPLSGPSSMVLVALIAAIYVAAFASSAVLLVDSKHFSPSRMAIPFN